MRQQFNPVKQSGFTASIVGVIALFFSIIQIIHYSNWIRITTTDKLTSSTQKEIPEFLPIISYIDLNTATKEELTSLPAIGDKLAERIIEYRKNNQGFNSVEELLKIQGVGKQKLNQIRPYCALGTYEK